MIRLLRPAAAGLALYLLMAALVLGCAHSGSGAPTAGQAVVTVEATGGVTESAADEIRQAADDTVAFFRENSGLQLNQGVNILLTPDRKAYIREIVDRFKISEPEAERVSLGTHALTGGRLIIVDMSGVPTVRQKTFLIAHELTHQIQRQIAGSQAGQVKWLLEGMAETTGAQVVSRRGYLSLDEYRNNWRSGLQQAADKPDLAELKSADGWSASLARYGSAATYKTAGLAAMTLTERFGQQKVLDYFSGLGRGESPEDSFQKAFGIPMADFIAEYRRLVRRAAS
ncbi:MAG: hypothetical protein P4N41_19120 [Negativicutes bacterium]|nr:hypothetical protein [Negativicutes bacterium]